MDAVEQTKQFWSKGFRAAFYRRFSGKFYRPMHAQVTDMLMARRAQNVLDIACGGGDFLAYFAERTPAVRLTGTDIAPGMVVAAQKKLGAQAEIKEARGGEQPFSSHSFDAITLMMAFHHFPRKLESLKKVGALLKPGGTLVIADVMARSNFEKKFWNVLEKVTAIRGYVDHYTERDLVALGEAAGFTVSCERVNGMASRYGVAVFTL